MGEGGLVGGGSSGTKANSVSNQSWGWSRELAKTINGKKPILSEKGGLQPDQKSMVEESGL